MAKNVYIGVDKQFSVTNLLDYNALSGNDGGYWGQYTFGTRYVVWSAAAPTGGHHSLLFNQNFSTGTAEATYQLTIKTGYIKVHLIPSHKYYFSVYLRQPSVVGSFDCYWPIAEPPVLQGVTVTAANTWQKKSTIVDRASFSEGDYEVRVDFNNPTTGSSLYVSNLVLVDLTATFGAGGEPDQAWCDANLDFNDTASDSAADTATITATGSVARRAKNIYIGVGGKARKVKKAYVGVGGKARLFYSANTAGENWKSGTNRPSNFTRKIAFGNGIFACVPGLGVTGTYVDITSDGITWKSDTLPTRGKYSHIAFGNGVFIVTRDESARAYVSDNGVDWSTSNLSQNRNWCGIAYGDKRFIILSPSGEAFHTEDNGNSWTQTNKIKDTVDTGTTWTSIGYGDGQFIALNSEGISVRGNIDSWTSITIPKGEWISVAYGNDTWVAVGPDGGTGTYNMMYSKDKGATWTAKRTSGFNYGYVCFGDGRFVTTSSDARNDIYWSEDGATWTRAIMPSNEIWYSAAFGNGRFVAIGNNSQVAYSE